MQSPHQDFLISVKTTKELPGFLRRKEESTLVQLLGLLSLLPFKLFTRSEKPIKWIKTTHRSCLRYNLPDKKTVASWSVALPCCVWCKVTTYQSAYVDYLCIHPQWTSMNILNMSYGRLEPSVKRWMLYMGICARIIVHPISIGSAILGDERQSKESWTMSCRPFSFS